MSFIRREDTPIILFIIASLTILSFVIYFAVNDEVEDVKVYKDQKIMCLTHKPWGVKSPTTTECYTLDKLN